MSISTLLAPAPPSTSARSIGRTLLGAMLTFAGISHLTFARKDFRAQVPRALPFSEDFTVVASGFVEIALGLSLIFTSKRRAPVGLVAASFFTAVFPGNIAQFLNRRSAFGLDTDKKRFVRLFMQPPLVAWALWSTDALRMARA